MSLRVTDSYLSRTMRAGMDRSLRALARAQIQAGSLRRVNSYVDDPRAVVAISRYNDLIAGNDQYTRNVDRARAFIQATDSSLQTLSGLLADVRVLMQCQLDPLSTAESRQQAAGELDGLVQAMVLTLNTQLEGDYIFAGQRTDVQPFAVADGAVQYQGDGGLIDVRLGLHTTLAVNLPGSELLGAGTSSLPGTVALSPMLSSTDLLADLDGGLGWDPGAIRIEDGDGNGWTVDLTGAVTVGDVLARIQAAGGDALIPGLHAEGSALQIIGAGPLTVMEVGNGTTAASLGLAGTAESGLLVGRDVRTPPRYATPLADIPALAGKLPPGVIVIESNGTATSVDLSSAATIGDLRALIQAAVPDLDLAIEGATLSLVSGTSTPFSVRSAAGGTTASDLGLSGTGTPARLFGLMASLREALETDDETGIRQAMAELAAVEGVVAERLVQVGGKEQILDWSDGLLRERDERLRSALSGERDADVSRLATELSQAEAAYQASLLVASRLFQTNLMQYLR